MRRVTLLALFYLPQEKKIAIERRLRGRDEYRRLQKADCVVVSYGKSGRTWLRVMLARFYQIKYGLPEKSLMTDFDKLHRRRREIPRIFFTHDNYLRDYTNNTDSKVDFYDKKVILLVRNPQDVAVSQFFQWKYRMKPGKKKLNAYPVHGPAPSLFEFVMQSAHGLPGIIGFLNDWEREIPRMKAILVVRYEDMRSDPENMLQRMLDFIETPSSARQIGEAVAFASYQNMKQLETKKRFRWNTRLLPADRNNPDSYKVRRAKVGGYRDYFDDREVAAIDAFVRARLTPFYGYGDGGKPA